MKRINWNYVKAAAGYIMLMLGAGGWDSRPCTCSVLAVIGLYLLYEYALDTGHWMGRR